MIAVITFLLAFLLLGIGFLLSYHKEVSNPEDAYRRDWKGFFWMSLRMVSLAVVTLFLFFVMLCFVGEDDPEDNLSWIVWFIVVVWFVSIPVLVIYVISVVQVIVHRQLYINKVFLGLHIINLLQVICVLILAILPQKSCTPEAMETDYKAHQTGIKHLIAVTKSWLPDSTGFSVEYSKNGEITDWGVNSKVDVDFEPDNWVTDNVKNRELKKIGLSVERLDSIRRERRSEFAGEGMREDDLIRWASLDQVKNYQIEGVNFWTQMYLSPKFIDKDGNSLILADGSAKANISAKVLSIYLRPYQIQKTNNNLYDGYTFYQAHYLAPFSYQEMKLCSPDGNVENSNLYQNIYWPLEPNGDALK